VDQRRVDKILEMTRNMLWIPASARHVTAIIGLSGPLCTAATVLVQSVALTRTHLLRAGNDTVSNVDVNVAWWC